MKKFLFAGVALAALVASPALAADLQRPPPAYKAPPPVVPIFTWTGCYFGGHAGGLFARKEWTEVPTGLDLGSHDANSYIAGVQAGCDYQFAGGFVIGIAGDYGWTDAEGTNLASDGFTNRSKIESLASVTGRIGYAWDRFLGYVKGGGAWERDNYDFSLGGVILATASETRSGWTVGVGGEYAFTNYLTGFIEYNYYDFGNRSNTFTDGSVIDIDERKSVVKAGLNFRFGGWGAPPVGARY